MSKEHERIDMSLSDVKPSAVSDRYTCSLLNVVHIQPLVHQQAAEEWSARKTSEILKIFTCLTMGSAGMRSCNERGDLSTGHCVTWLMARTMQSWQNVCEHDLVLVGSVKGIRQMAHI